MSWRVIGFAACHGKKLSHEIQRFYLFKGTCPNLSNNRGNDLYAKRGYFKELTEDVFLDNLSLCIKWANEYGDKYVSKEYFIYGILGSKRYEYAKSREMLQKLITDGKLGVKKNEEEKDCLYIIEQ